MLEELLVLVELTALNELLLLLAFLAASLIFKCLTTF